MSLFSRSSWRKSRLFAGAAALFVGSLLAAQSVSFAQPAKDPKADRLWRAKCASCHGDDGKGQTEQGKKMGIRDMTAAAWQKEFTDAQLTQVIQDGFKRNKDGKAQEMEPFKDKLRPEQLPLIVTYVRALAK